MNYVERIEWLTADKIAAAASINPSTDDTLVFDLRAGKVLMDYTDDYTDDHGGAVFSSDGEHVADVTGALHWTPDSESAPELQAPRRNPDPRSASCRDRTTWPDSAPLPAASP